MVALRIAIGSQPPLGCSSSSAWRPCAQLSLAWLRRNRSASVPCERVPHTWNAEWWRPSSSCVCLPCAVHVLLVVVSTQHRRRLSATWPAGVRFSLDTSSTTPLLPCEKKNVSFSADPPAAVAPEDTCPNHHVRPAKSALLELLDHASQQVSLYRVNSYVWRLFQLWAPDCVGVDIAWLRKGCTHYSKFFMYVKLHQWL